MFIKIDHGQPDNPGRLSTGAPEDGALN